MSIPFYKDLGSDEILMKIKEKVCLGGAYTLLLFYLTFSPVLSSPLSTAPSPNDLVPYTGQSIVVACDSPHQSHLFLLVGQMKSSCMCPVGCSLDTTVLHNFGEGLC